MGGHCILDDGEAEAGAAEFAAASLVDAVETFEDVLQMLMLYTRAVVADGELIEMAAFDLGLPADDVEPGSSVGVGNGIVDKIAEDAVKQALVAQHLHVLR